METAEPVAVDSAAADSAAAVFVSLEPDPTGAATTAGRRIDWGRGGDGLGNCRCAQADTYYLPVTGHDATGPVALWAAAHLMLHIPNAMVLETVRAYYNGWYNDLVTERIPINAGMLSLPEKPGLGIALREEVLNWPDARIEDGSGAESREVD